MHRKFVWFYFARTLTENSLTVLGKIFHSRIFPCYERSVMLRDITLSGTFVFLANTAQIGSQFLRLRPFK